VRKFQWIRQLNGRLKRWRKEEGKMTTEPKQGGRGEEEEREERRMDEI
jgi:3-mercaptopyruvate sulfurtransferase SseA